MRRTDGRTGVVSSEDRPAPTSGDLTGPQTQHAGNVLITCSIRTFRSQQAGSSWGRETFHRCRKRSGHFGADNSWCSCEVQFFFYTDQETERLLFVTEILLKYWQSVRVGEPQRCQRYVLSSRFKQSSRLDSGDELTDKRHRRTPRGFQRHPQSVLPPPSSSPRLLVTPVSPPPLTLRSDAG